MNRSIECAPLARQRKRVNVKFPATYEPDTGLVHFAAPPEYAAWSLCGQSPVEPTDKECTCLICMEIARYCQSRAKV